MSVFRDALAGGLHSIRAAAGADIVYRRGDEAIALRATVGQTDVKVTSGDKVEIRQKWRDYIVATDDLVIAGLPTKPARGDEITDGEEVFRVANLPGGNLFDVEAQGLVFRIHATRHSGGTA